MPRGRPRKSSAERFLSGRKGRTIPGLVFIPDGAPFTPDHLADDAKACVEHLKSVIPAGVLTSVDSYLLAAFATAWAWHKAATEEMSQPGFQPLLATKKGQVQNPWFRILSDQSRTMLSLATKLYLTPADRTSIHLDYSEQHKSKFDGLLGAQTESSSSLNS